MDVNTVRLKRSTGHTLNFYDALSVFGKLREFYPFRIGAFVKSSILLLRPSARQEPPALVLVIITPLNVCDSVSTYGLSFVVEVDIEGEKVSL